MRNCNVSFDPAFIFLQGLFMVLTADRESSLSFDLSFIGYFLTFQRRPLNHEDTKLDDNGRILLPSDLRQKANLKEGDEFAIDSLGEGTFIIKKIDYHKERAKSSGIPRTLLVFARERCEGAVLKAGRPP